MEKLGIDSSYMSSDISPTEMPFNWISSEHIVSPFIVK
jgi:hypothetical protein